MKNQKNVVAGLGEISMPILKLLSNSTTTVGYDINPKLMDKKNLNNMVIMIRFYFMYVFLLL